SGSRALSRPRGGWAWDTDTAANASTNAGTASSDLTRMGTSDRNGSQSRRWAAPAAGPRGVPLLCRVPHRLPREPGRQSRRPSAFDGCQARGFAWAWQGRPHAHPKPWAWHTTSATTGPEQLPIASPQRITILSLMVFCSPAGTDGAD